MATHSRRALDSVPLAVAGAAAFAVCAVVVVLAGAPIHTPDLWFHLAMGEAYFEGGPWLDRDPLLHTAHADAPVQHEWLFGVFVHWIDAGLGFYGLRTVHAIAAAAILALAFVLARRATRSTPIALALTSVLAVLAWWRLFQLRPDLVTIPATLLLYSWLLRPKRGPSRIKIAAALVLLWLWVNMHSLFAVGLLLVGSALPVLWLRDRARATRVGLAVALGALITLANPRGLAQHLTFLTSSRDAAIWAIRDEWSPFIPWAFPEAGYALTPLVWGLLNVLLCASLISGVLWLRARRAGADRVNDDVDVLAALTLASWVAIGVSIRFAWLGFFPALFAARMLQRSMGETGLRWCAAAICAVLALGFTQRGITEDAEAAGFLDPSTYFALPYHPEGYAVPGVRFLRETGLTGNLYNTYWMGGFLGYWLAPNLRTFIDGRTEHYPPEVFDDYVRVAEMIPARAGESLLATLDRRRVDVFFGVGTPVEGGDRYTTIHLERAGGWVLIFRARDHAIYLRDLPRNRENFARVERYYRTARVPFDRQRGFEPARALALRPAWALRHQLAPADFQRTLAWSEGADSMRRFLALDALGFTYYLLGAYPDSLAVDRAASALRPRAAGPRRRSVAALLQMNRVGEALSAANELRRVAPEDPRSARSVNAVARYRNAAASGKRLVPLTAAIRELPVVNAAELARFYAEHPVDVALEDLSMERTDRAHQR